MRHILNTLMLGGREPFKNAQYIVLFCGLFVAMFALFVLIPVWTVSGNTLTTQLGIFTVRDYAVLVLLSLLSSIFISMQVYVIRKRKNIADASTAVGSGVGALVAGIAGTAFCASCLAPLFAIFGIGFGGVIFVLEYRWYLVVGIILLLLFAIYLTARKVIKICTTC